MNFKSVSRRDDLISLTYLLVYMVQGSLGILGVPNHMSKREQFDKICVAKNQLNPETLCQSRRASVFLDFVRQVHSLSFTQRPDYSGLVSMLETIMIDHNLPLTNEYDWSIQQDSRPAGLPYCGLQTDERHH